MNCHNGCAACTIKSTINWENRYSTVAKWTNDGRTAGWMALAIEYIGTKGEIVILVEFTVAEWIKFIVNRRREREREIYVCGSCGSRPCVHTPSTHIQNMPKVLTSLNIDHWPHRHMMLCCRLRLYLNFNLNLMDTDSRRFSMFYPLCTSHPYFIIFPLLKPNRYELWLARGQVQGRENSI